MPERDESDRLDEAVETIMTDPDAAPPLEPRLAELLQVAAALRDLPRPEFRARLQADLEGRGAVAAAGLSSHDLREALRGLPELTITADTTAEEADSAFRPLARLNQCTLNIGRFRGQSPWERHPNGDELLHVLDGEVEVTVLTEDGPVRRTVGAGSIFVCPRGLWHRLLAPRGVTALYATPMPSEISWAEDPRER